MRWAGAAVPASSPLMGYRMRRWASALLVVGIVAGLVGVGAPAYAVQPPPPAVDPLPVLPSQLNKALTGSPMANQAYTGILKAMLDLVKNGAPTAPALPAVPPKVLTPAAQLARTGGGATGVLTAFQVGWALGQGGLLAYSLATDATYEGMLCSQPDWYQNVTTFVMLSVVDPTCAGEIVDIAPGNYSAVTYAGASWRLISMPAVDSPNGPLKTVCFKFTPSGTVSSYQYGNGWATNAGGYSAPCPAGADAPNRGLYSPWSVGEIRFRNGAGTVLHTATPEFVPGGSVTRTPRCRIDWADGTQSLGNGTPYTEDEGIPVTAVGLGCTQAETNWAGTGQRPLPLRIRVDSEDDAGAITSISDQTTGAGEYTPQQEESLKPGSGGLVLYKVAGTLLDSCNAWAAECAGWWEQSEEGTNTTLYRCMYNGTLVDLVECGTYRYTFDTKTSTPTITTPSGGTEPWSSTPTPGNSINPGTGPGTGASPADSCFTDGWASVMNPIDWVLVPVKCALVWAFVPRSSIVSAAQGGMQDKIDNSVIGSIAGGLTTLGAAWDAGVGCGGLPIHLEGFGVTLVHANLLESCTEPAAGIAATIKTVLTAVIIFGAFLAVLRYLASLFGFIGFGRGDGVVGSDSGPRFS